jgi:hypothetical protein
MKARYILVLASTLTLLACQQQAKVQSRQIDGRSYTTMSHGDLTLTYVELDKSTAVVFRSVAGGGGLDDLNPKCISCTVSKISECAGAGDSAAINACAKKKCQDAGSCPAAGNFSFGVIRL